MCINFIRSIKEINKIIVGISNKDQYGEGGDRIPTEYALMHAYPNPFNPVTNITYGLPEYTNIQIVIFDLSGKQIESLINEFQSPGYYSINWNADNHPSGVYFVKIVAGDYINTQKLMLVK